MRLRQGSMGGAASTARENAMPQSNEERFWALVDRRGEPGCWPWRGDEFSGPTFTVDLVEKEDEQENEGTIVSASEYAFALVNGPVPDGRVLRRRCITTHCVSPEHFEVTTRQEDWLHYPDASELAEMRRVETYLPG